MAVRRRTENGQLLLVPRHTVILVSRDDLPLDELVRRHRAKQGHIAQALLRAVQFTALPRGARRDGIRQVIRYVMRTEAHMVRTARRTCLRFAKTSFCLDWLYEAMTALEARAPPPATPA